jgi:hypothetical protein
MLPKLLLIAIGLSLLCRWGLGRWPWELIGRAADRGRSLARARRLLGVVPGAGREDIVAAHRRLTTQVHPDKGGTDAAMQEVNAARDLLLDELPGSRDGAEG